MTRTKQWMSNHNFTILHASIKICQVNKPRPRPVKTTLSVRACCRLPSCRKAHFLTNRASTKASSHVSSANCKTLVLTVLLRYCMICMHICCICSLCSASWQLELQGSPSSCGATALEQTAMTFTKAQIHANH